MKNFKVSRISLQSHPDRRDSPNSARNMYQSVGPVENGEGILVFIHEPLLNASFLYRKQETQPAELLEFQYCYAMRLGNVPDTLSYKQFLRCNGCHPVESIVDDPIEHFDQEREFLEQPAMNVVFEARSIRRVYPEAAPVSLLECMFGSGNKIIVVAFVMVR